METPEIIATGKGNFTPVKPGTYLAKCYSMVVLGTIEGEYKGVPNIAEKVQISWELPEERREFREGEGEKPYTISKEYTLSLGEKSNLRRDLKSWRGRDFTQEELAKFNIAKLVGVNCMLSISNEEKNGKTYAKITAIGPPMKGMTDYKQFNPSFILTYQNWDWDAFKSLPEWLRKKMETSDEYKAISNAYQSQAHENDLMSARAADNDDLPF